ncbi:MAG: hypothetical protein OXD47_05260 [Gammaproteobacteria bacterium]|nr:hypothetical protein [Gammaproteobacteria bacterium]
MTDFQRLIATAPEPEVAALRLARMQEDAGLRAELDLLPAELAADFINLVGYSNFLFNYLCRHPQHLRLLGQPCELDPAQLDALHDAEALRRFKYEQLLKISWMDVSGRYPYEVVLAQLSLLADLILTRAFELCFKPHNNQAVGEHIAIFALGKLGASELNYSSDVDLIFACRNHDESAGLQAQELQSLLTKGLRQFTRMLEETTRNGFLYRVDLKLRPWGKSGPLFLTVDETENYYQASTEAWERLTWLRARCVAGDPELGAELLARLRPFVFIRSMSATDLERFVSIKGEMAKIRARVGQWHVKLGRGGIRDIEFFVQILQLVSAARHAELRTTNTLEVLESLRRLNFIGGEEEQELRTAYLFLRRLENRLQMADEKQVHALSDDAADRVRVARSLSMTERADDAILADFEQTLRQHQAVAEKYFEKILPEAEDEAAPGSPQASFDGAWNKVQAEVSFARWTELCEKEQWGDRPLDKTLLVNIFGASWYFTRYIFFRGYEITELIDHYREKPINPEEMLRALQVDVLKQDAETGLTILSSVKNQWMLLLLIRFLQGEMELAEVERNLTLLAECVFDAMVRQMPREHRKLFDNVAVLGMGRMAGYEMIFGSDLDLIFLYRPQPGSDTSQVARELQALMRHLARVSPAGLLYEVDMRLRPHGTSGSLITPLDSFIDYHHSDRAVWERQMMTRCRPIYDPQDMGREALQAISGSIYADHDRAILREEIVSMRALIEDTLGSPRHKHDIKRGAGGIMDIDFITHFLQLSHGKDHAQLQTGSTRVALQQLAELHYIDAETAGILLQAYDFLKQAELCMRLIDLKPNSTIPADHNQNAVLSRGMGYPESGTEEFMTGFLQTRTRVREAFTQLVGTPTP